MLPVIPTTADFARSLGVVSATSNPRVSSALDRGTLRISQSWHPSWRHEGTAMRARSFVKLLNQFLVGILLWKFRLLLGLDISASSSSGAGNLSRMRKFICTPILHCF